MNEHIPLVSIGMPVYDGEHFISRGLDSLLNQDFHDFELIISDNSSTDKTFQICEEYAAKDNRISLNRNLCNIGALNNFKVVLERAKGEYFMWAAVDDYWSTDFISTLLKELEMHLEAGVAMCASNRVRENGNLQDTIRFIDKDDPNSKNYCQMLKNMAKSGKKYNLYIYGLFRTKLLKKAMKICFDVPTWDRVFMCQLTLATHFRYIDKVMYIKTLYARIYKDRWPKEKFSKILESKFSDINILFKLGEMLLRSKIIPWYRKLYLPIALWEYGRLLLLGKFVDKTKQLYMAIKKLFLPS